MSHCELPCAGDHHHHEECHHDHGHAHHHHGHDHCHHGTAPKKEGILLAAFGVALPDARSGYETFAAEVAARYPGVKVNWAYTAHKVRRKLKQRGFEHDSVAEALCRMHDEGVTHLAVQSLHTTPGVEYHWTLDQALAYRHPRKGFRQVEMGGPLLMTDDTLCMAVDGLTGYIPTERTADEAVVLVGHGTYHEGHQRYLDYEQALKNRDPLLFMSTLMGRPHCDDVMEALREAGVKTVWLVPFMSVPGHHVQIDLFGDHDSSWKNRMAEEGFAVRIVKTGTLEHKPFRDIWMRQLDAVCGQLF